MNISLFYFVNKLINSVKLNFINKVMNSVNKFKFIRLSKKGPITFQKILKPKEIDLDKSFLKAKTNFFRPIKMPNGKINSFENSKIFLNESNEKQIPLNLPSLAATSTSSHKILNSSMDTILPDIRNNSPVQKNQRKFSKFKIKKPNEIRKIFTPHKKNKSLISVYNENLLMKKKLEEYKIKKSSLQKFSYKNYNYNLLQLSSMNLSRDNIKSFKKNMQIIEQDMNGRQLNLKNHWQVFLYKIQNFAPEGLKKKLKYLSDIRQQKSENKKDNNSKINLI